MGLVALARCVDRPATFLARQVLRRGRTASYRLRGTGVVVHLRHGTPDVNTLDQIVRHGHYDIPSPIAAALASAPHALDVLDLGANIGLFGALVRARWPNARITALEPDPSNANIHAQSIRSNDAEDAWRLIEACAAPTAGETAFAAGNFANSRMIDADRMRPGVLTVPTMDVLALIEDADLVKIDIEGAEWPILRDPRFRRTRARAIALEYHPAAGVDDPRAESQQVLQDAGFATVEARLESLPEHGMIWGWRPTR